MVLAELSDRTMSTSADVSLFIEEQPRAGLINQTQNFLDYVKHYLGGRSDAFAESYSLLVLQKLLWGVDYSGSASATMVTSMLDYLTQAGETFMTTLTEVEGRLARVEEALADMEGQSVFLEDLEDTILPRLPLSVQSVNAKIRIGGAGKPAFKTTAEISLYD